jgi:hypothetical protein
VPSASGPKSFLFLDCLTLNMKAPPSSETSITLDDTNIPEDLNFQGSSCVYLYLVHVLVRCVERFLALRFGSPSCRLGWCESLVLALFA